MAKIKQWPAVGNVDDSLLLVCLYLAWPPLVVKIWTRE